MRDADRRPFAEMIGAVYELYNRPLSETILAMWWDAMSPYDLATVRAALSRHAMNPDSGQFIPKPADVVRELGGTSADASMLAFAKVTDAVRRIGTYESVTFDDPITNRVIADLGGWAWLGAQTEKEWPFVEKRFRDAYRAWRARGLFGTEMVTRLPGRIEMTNAATGYASEVRPRLIGDPRVAGTIAVGSFSNDPNWPLRIAAEAKSQSLALKE